MIEKELVLEGWPIIAFIISIVIPIVVAISSDKRHDKSTNKRIDYLQSLLRSQTKHIQESDKDNRKAIHERMRKEYELKHPDKPLNKDLKEVLDSAATTTSSMITRILNGEDVRDVLLGERFSSTAGIKDYDDNKRK